MDIRLKNRKDKTVEPKMRAKMRISEVHSYEGAENLKLQAVGRNDGYPDDGSDENNTYAKYTPSAELNITIQNPSLLGQFKVGDEYYLDFYRAAVPVKAE